MYFEKLTTRQQAGLHALATGLVKTWKEAYLIASDKSTADVENLAALPSLVTRWKQKNDTQQAFKEITNIVNDHDAKNREKGRQEERDRQNAEGSEGTDGQPGRKKAGKIDYSDPANQTAKLNELINTADDPGEALDALKVIIQTQKADRDAAKAQKTVQYYRPLRCNECPLYENARQKDII